MTKKKYTIPSIETICINSKDIITTSDFKPDPEITDPEIGPFDE